MLDYFDVAQTYQDNPVEAFKQSQCKFLVIAFSSDWRFSPQCSEEITDAIVSADKDVSYLRIESDQGHDAFLLPNEHYEKGLSQYLQRVAQAHFGAQL